MSRGIGERWDSGDFERDMVVGAGRASQTAAELLGFSHLNHP